MDIQNNKQVIVEFYAEDISNRYKHVSRCLQKCYKQEDLEELENFIEECCKICRDTFHCNLIQVGSCEDTLVIKPLERDGTDNSVRDIVLKVKCAKSPPYKYGLRNNMNYYIGTKDMNKILPVIRQELKEVIEC